MLKKLYMRKQLPQESLLLVGKLALKNKDDLDNVYLVIEVWCPFCKKTHTHGWNRVPCRLDYVSERKSHCYYEYSPFKDKTYYVGLNPLDSEHNVKVITEAVELLKNKKGQNKLSNAPI